MAKLRSFTKTDYYGFADAGNLPSGKLPQIVSGEFADVVVAGDSDNNIFVGIYPVDDETGGYYKIVNNEGVALELARVLADYLDNDIISFEKLAKRHEFMHV